MRRADSLEKTLCWKDWRQVEKGTAEGEMLEWYHWLNGLEFEQALGDVKDREAWSATVHGVTKSWTRLSNWTTMVMNTAGRSRRVNFAYCTKFNNFKVSLIFGFKVETPNSIFMPFSYNSCPNSPFTSDKHASFDIEFSPSGTMPSYEYVWQTGILDALDW